MNPTETENNYYRKALLTARIKLIKLIQNGKIANNAEIRGLIDTLDRDWRYRQYACPKCGESASRDCRLGETNFLYDWVCWKCGYFTTTEKGK